MCFLNLPLVWNIYESYKDSYFMFVNFPWTGKPFCALEIFYNHRWWHTDQKGNFSIIPVSLKLPWPDCWPLMTSDILWNQLNGKDITALKNNCHKQKNLPFFMFPFAFHFQQIGNKSASPNFQALNSHPLPAATGQCFVTLHRRPSEKLKSSLIFHHTPLICL